jgi:lysophospholipase L1-like esterase
MHSLAFFYSSPNWLGRSEMPGSPLGRPAHRCGVKLIGATISPFEGVELSGYYSESKEAIRQAVNKWIRTSGSFDAVIDFDAVLRDPDHPSRLLPRFASPDHLHPNDFGYQAMADAGHYKR